MFAMQIRITLIGLFLILAILMVSWCSPRVRAQEASITFVPRKLMVDANEGIDLADFNGDKKLDVVAGRFWYAAPDFIPRPVRNIKDWNGYVESNGDFAFDVNQDGKPDVVAGGFIDTKIHWYENPGPEALKLGRQWKQHLLVDTKQSQNEISFLFDLDGDQQPEWITNSWNGRNPILAWQFQREGKKVSFKRILIGADGQGHGLGVGDIDNDGDPDVVTATGWYENPGVKPFSKPWKFHKDWNLGQASCPILIRDLDGDGKNDMIWGKGHDYGLYWWRQKGKSESGKIEFESNTIDDKFSQPHAIHFADLTGDGKDELITGKRVFAHNGGDPGGKEMACMYYYRWNKESKSFQKHVIDEGHVGTGLQIRTGDLDGDNRTDIAVAGKDGTWVLFNRAKK